MALPAVVVPPMNAVGLMAPVVPPMALADMPFLAQYQNALDTIATCFEAHHVAVTVAGHQCNRRLIDLAQENQQLAEFKENKDDDDANRDAIRQHQDNISRLQAELNAAVICMTQHRQFVQRLQQVAMQHLALIELTLCLNEVCRNPPAGEDDNAPPFAVQKLPAYQQGKRTVAYCHRISTDIFELCTQLIGEVKH